MIAIQYRKSVPRYLLLRTLGSVYPSIYTGSASPIALCDIPALRLPTPEWIRIRPILSGICGSDLATLGAKTSAYLSPFTSTPFVLGHEVVGRVTELGSAARGFSVGDRVVLQPALGCTVRGINPPCRFCGAGQMALCCNVTRGDISAGIQTGYCRDTGGAWGESLVAHPSQLYRIPDNLDDIEAVLAEPLACALHAVLRASWDGARTVLVMGCGIIGLLVVAAIRTLEHRPRLVAVAKYPHQRDQAQKLGADQAMLYDRRIEARYKELAGVLGADLYFPEIGKPTVVGGADITFDCVASSTSIDDCLRLTRSGGAVILVGMPAIPSGIDWTSMWYKELTVCAAYAYGQENQGPTPRSTFSLAIEILGKIGPQLRSLVSQPFALQDYRQAIATALHTGSSRSIKTVFRI